MSNTIRETITANVPSGYERYTEPVIRLLETREAQIADELVRAAQAQGLDVASTRGVLEDAGLTMPRAYTPETPAVTGIDRSTVGRVASELQQGIQQLFSNAARSLGL